MAHILSNERKFAVLLATFILSFLSVGFGFALSVFYVEFIRTFNCTRSEAALVQSIYMPMNVGSGLIWSYPVLKYGPTKSMLVGAVGMSVGLFIAVFSVNIWMAIFFIGIVAGFGSGIILLAPFMVVGKVINKHKTAALASLSVGGGLGQFGLTFLTEKLIEQYNWNGALMVCSALALNTFPFGMILYFSDKHQDKGTDNITETERSSNKLFKTVLFKDWKFIVYMIISFMYSFSILAESKFLVDIATLKGFTRETGSILVSVIGISNFAGRVIGTVAKLFISRKALVQMVVLMCVCAFTHLLILKTDAYAGLLTAAILNGITLGLSVSSIPTLMLEVFELKDFAATLAMWNISTGVGNFVGGYIGGFINDSTGSYDLLFTISIVSSVVTAILFLTVTISISSWCSSKRHGYHRIG